MSAEAIRSERNNNSVEQTAELKEQYISMMVESGFTSERAEELHKMMVREVRKQG